MRRTALVITILLLCTRPLYSYDLGFLELHGFGSVGFMTSSANNYLIDSDGGSFQFNDSASAALLHSETTCVSGSSCSPEIRAPSAIMKLK